MIDSAVRVYLVGYGLLALLLSLYGLHAYTLSVLFLKLRRARPEAPATAAPAPAVTVQLPVYNEIYVVDRLIAAVCALRYPRDRFEVQVLDDSTDETSERIARLVPGYRAAGIDIVHLRRAVRTGFKGGALREGLRRARGELIAVFDADFSPPPDFLERAVPFFRDPAIGMVQTRWGHLNADYSLLTRAQAMALDGHFMIEQTVRNRLGVFINFNGTAGIWRRDCIHSAGDWQDDTLTEDLDLSYRAQLGGWRFLFLPDLVCSGELPGEANSFKVQQFRWAKGSMQTALKLLPRVLAAPLPLFTKIHATIHLTHHLVYPLLLLLALCSLPSLVVLHEYPEHRPFFRLLTSLAIASFGHPFLYAVAQQAITPRWRRQLLLIPVILAGGMGIAVNNTRAVLEALRGRASVFERTPKYRIESRSGHWRDKHYRAPFSWVAALELAFAAYMGAAMLYAAHSQSYAILPFLALYFAGFAYIGGLSFLHSLGRNRPALMPASAPSVA